MSSMFDSVLSYFDEPGVNSSPQHVLSSLFSQSNQDLPLRIQQHLARVYSSLAATVLFAAVGCVLDIKYHFGGLLTSLAGCVLIYLLYHEKLNGAAANIPLDRKTQIRDGVVHSSILSPADIIQSLDHLYNKRSSYLFAFGFCEGASLGPLVNYAVRLDSAIVPTALLCTFVIFTCFSWAALTAPRRSYFYLRGLLASIATASCLLAVISIFYYSPFLHTVHSYASLIVFCLYVLYDTQIIIERAEFSKDYTWHAVSLFIDFIAIFRHILRILTEREQKQQQRHAQKRR
jgi:FtsH-binding integral membrane protein